MSDQFSINRVGTVPGQEYNYQAAQAAQQNAAMATTIKNVEQPDKKSETQKDKSEEERNQEQQATFRNVFRNVEMDFNVDQDTNEITLNILDKDTREIIRTIPERAWKDVSVAELFRVTA
jgi:uncharacterized FlaG/YvyC family protein